MGSYAATPEKGGEEFIASRFLHKSPGNSGFISNSRKEFVRYWHRAIIKEDDGGFRMNRLYPLLSAHLNL